MAPSLMLRERVKQQIHHERQEEGSMLCAQHALNSLLQGNYFDAAQLAQVAAQHDALEREQLQMTDAEWDQREQGTRNADETGFFSVAVIETALQAWGLSLVRWASSSMRSRRSHPEDQLAFILNLESHWFTFRSFGDTTASDSATQEPLWFNLNSFLPEPAWVGSGYLGALLDQSQTEGYSVFVVVPSVEDLQASQPVLDQFRNTPADVEASSISQSSTGLEDEDAELQRAIRESMAAATTSAEPETSVGTLGGSSSGSTIPPPKPPAGRRRKSKRQGEEDLEEALQASMRAHRSKGLEIPSGSGTSSLRQGDSSSNAIAIDDEDSFQPSSSTSRSPFLNPVLRSHFLGADGDDLDAEDLEALPLPRTSSHSQRGTATNPIAFDDDDEDMSDVDAGPAPPGLLDEWRSAATAFNSLRDRDYDDEDAQLQRALAASLASSGDAAGMSTSDEAAAIDPLMAADIAEQTRLFSSFSANSTSTTRRRSRSPTPADVGRIAKMREEARRKQAEERAREERHQRGEFTPEPRPAIPRKGQNGVGQGNDTSSDEDDDDDEDEEQRGQKTESAVTTAASASTSASAQVSPEELRRMRLARFGG